MQVRPERNALRWSAAVGTAVAAHVLLMVGYAGLNTYGAAGEGQGGIELGLGMLGEMGESLESSDANEMLELPAELPPEPPLPETPPSQPEARILQADPVQQVTEVTVQTETSEQAVDAGEQTETGEPLSELPPIEPETVLAAVTPSEGSGTGAETVTRRRQGAGAGVSPGAGGSRGRQAEYVAILAGHVNRYKHYPMAARRARQEGTATLSLVILRDGTVKNFRISKSSGWEALDAAALRMLERAQPLPAFPASMEEEEIPVNIPVSFGLNPL